MKIILSHVLVTETICGCFRVYSIPISNFRSAGWVVMECYSLCLSWNVLISMIVLKDRLLDLVIFIGGCLFSGLETSFHAFVDLMAVDKRTDVVSVFLPWLCCWYNGVPLVCIFDILLMMYHRKILFWSCLYRLWMLPMLAHLFLPLDLWNFLL